MGNPLALEQFARLADRRLDDVMEGYLRPYQEMIGELFGTMPLDKAFAELFDIGSMPDIPPFTGKLDFLDIAPGYYTRIEPKEYAGGIQVQKKFIEDKQFGVLDDLQGGLLKSYGRTKEKSAVRAFGYAFSTSWDFMTNEEAVSLCSASHLTKSGAITSLGFSNYGTSLADKAAVNATRILFKKFRDDIGELYESEPDAILCPEALYDTFLEITGYDPRSGATSDLDPTTAQHRVNTLYKGLKVIPWRRLDDYSTTAWFMVDTVMMKKMLKWIDRIKPETATQADFHTFTVMQSLRGRFGWGWRNWRWIYGHRPS